MSIIAAALRELIAAGVTGDALVTAIERIENASSPKGPSSAAVRMRRYRDRREELGMHYQFDGERFRPLLIERDGEQCIYCGATDDLVIDHITPVAQGGTDDLGNLGLACRACNGGKSGRTPEQWGRTIAQQSATQAYRIYCEQSATKRNKAQHVQTHIENIDKIKKDSMRNKKGARLDPTWSLSDAERQMARHVGLTDSETDREAARFRDYWIGKPGAGGVKLDWQATWRNWCRTAAERLGRASAPIDDKRSGDAARGWRPGLRTTEEILAEREKLNGNASEGNRLEQSSPMVETGLRPRSEKPELVRSKARQPGMQSLDGVFRKAGLAAGGIPAAGPVRDASECEMDGTLPMAGMADR